ncbi:phosphate ABC transporter permease [Pannus brasiliensis CCIBt3594]|uniref:Phosphate ABC transporter permease n=1 Tax=Pannus brasiliensis CCIBt3594 TaxID=1427578 RepID=A0AAW9QQR9_9CHRO
MLVPLTRETFNQLIPPIATGPQYACYWGKWPDVLQRLFISVVALTAAWLIGMLFGPGGIAVKLIFDIIAGMYWLWGPVYWASLRNSTYRRIPYCGFWRGRVLDAFVTEELVGEEETVNPRGELVIVENREKCINLEIGDRDGFSAIVRAPLQRIHKSIRPGMIAETLFLSRSPDLGEVTKIADIYLPQLDRWVGEYPYLRRDLFRQVSRELGGQPEPRPTPDRSANRAIRRRTRR